MAEQPTGRFTVRAPTIAPKKGSLESVTKVSNWFVLINSNVSMTSKNQFRRISKILQNAADKVFSPQNFGTLFYQDTKTKTPYSPKVANAPPPDLDVVYGGEVGSVQKRIHAHIDIAIVHYGKIQMDYKEAHKQLREEILKVDSEIENPFISIKHYQSKAGYEAYLGKGQALESLLHIEDLSNRVASLKLDNLKGVDIEIPQNALQILL